ncbi:MAG: hypothetical protein CYG60_17465 [Actinobacteria bacterium]|nr:MAG: hypothetical protein CYG60_17465 [Actinomycetota bacterium]
MGEGRLLLLNDNNYPLSAGRNPTQPDDTEAIIVRSDSLRGAGMPGTGGPSVPALAGLAVLGLLGAAGTAILLRRVLRPTP